jgi:hypothetical protein
MVPLPPYGTSLLLSLLNSGRQRQKTERKLGSETRQRAEARRREGAAEARRLTAKEAARVRKLPLRCCRAVLSHLWRPRAVAQSRRGSVARTRPRSPTVHTATRAATGGWPLVVVLGFVPCGPCSSSTTGTERTGHGRTGFAARWCLVAQRSGPRRYTTWQSCQRCGGAAPAVVGSWATPLGTTRVTLTPRTRPRWQLPHAGGPRTGRVRARWPRLCDGATAALTGLRGIVILCPVLLAHTKLTQST